MTPQPEPQACEIHGPQFPTMDELRAAQARAIEVPDADFPRALQERMQTEGAYLEGYDREFLTAAAVTEPELEAEI